MHIWLRLKPELLPCVSQETDKFIQEYHVLLEKHKNGDGDMSEEIEKRQILIKERIADFDKFYEVNYSCSTIGYFEKLKMKLRKLLYLTIQEPDQEQSSPQGLQESTFVDMFDQYQQKRENNEQFLQVPESPEEKKKSKGSKSSGSSKSPSHKIKTPKNEGVEGTKVKRSSSKEKNASENSGKAKEEGKRVIKTKKSEVK